MIEPTVPPVDPLVWAAAQDALDRFIADSPTALAQRRRAAGRSGRKVLATWMAPERRARLDADLAPRLADEVDPEAGASVATRWAIDIVRRHDRIPAAVRAVIEPTVRTEAHRIYHGGAHHPTCPPDCPCGSVLGELVTDHIWTCFGKGIDDEDAVVAAWNRSVATRRYRDQVDKIAHAEHGTSQKVRRSITGTARMTRALAAPPRPTEEDQRLMAELLHRHVLLRLGEDTRMRSIDSRMGQWATQLGIDVAAARRLHDEAVRRVRAAAEDRPAFQAWVDRHLDIGRVTSGDALLDTPRANGEPRDVEEVITALGGRARDDERHDDERTRMATVLGRAAAHHQAGIPPAPALEQAIAEELGSAATVAARASEDWPTLLRAVRQRAAEGARCAA